MTEQDDATRIWDLIDTIGFCMLTTQGGSDLRARPMTAHTERIENALYFLTDVASHKDEDIALRPNVCVAFADPKKQKYVSVSGRAEILENREWIEELWGGPAKAWWNSPDDPAIRVLKVTPTFAEYWDCSSTVISYIKMIAAAISNTKPDMGANAKVDL
ncbi:pyridoxamine 5'-phosphate oxidase family protein [Rhizobium rhizogenes]|uniref:pyridoxamine 5'-phosphate oxidase family protein n=1 Tax=Rhizobium rhizogenes TaxID=359 RepID=UPI001574C94B|nr:pyridoxamine 5'-phosphate oxidase family protein [Rhizobium rhizogenes]NTI33007.1 pyridoxamine 5'-phosphate oxidase family protein [Rhizobium rhizogenes]